MERRNKILYGIAIVIILFLVAVALTPTPPPEPAEKTWSHSGSGDIYDIELKCDDSSASQWVVTVTAKLTEEGEGDVSDFISLSILHYTGEPSALDEGWHVYQNQLTYTEGAYASVTLMKVELDPSQTYRVAVETDPDGLNWALEISEEW